MDKLLKKLLQDEIKNMTDDFEEVYEQFIHQNADTEQVDPVDELEDELSEDDDDPISEEQVKALLAPRPEGRMPDGVVAYFVESILDSNFKDEFEFVAKGFLLHEHDNLPQYQQKMYYQNEFINGYGIPYTIFQIKIIDYMWIGYESGNAFCKELLLLIYKTYFKSEYNQLKKFSKIGFIEITDFCGNISSILDEHDLFSIEFKQYQARCSRVLCAASLMNIEIAHDADFFFNLLDEEWEKQKKNSEGDIDFWADDKAVDDWINEIDQSQMRIQSLLDDDEECNGLVQDITGSINGFLKASINKIFDINSILWRVYLDEGKMPELMAKAANLLETEDCEYELKDLIYYAYIYKFVQALSENYYGTNAAIEIALGVDTNENPNARIDLSKIDTRLADTAYKGKEQGINVIRVSKASSNTSDVKETSEELYDLQRRLANAKNEISNLHEENKRLRKEIEAQNRQLSHLEQEHQELVVLRNLAYRTSANDSSDSKNISIAEMETDIRSNALCIIGGNQNWTKKLKERFPNWTFIDPDHFSTVSEGIFDKAEFIYFFTETLGHSSFYKYTGVLKRQNKKWAYLHGVNIEANISQIYSDINKSTT